MGKQYNKVIKKKRHIAYLKRKKAAVKKTAKPAKKVAPASRKKRAGKD